MANYNPLTTPRTNLNRNAFDLSQRHLHSQKVGQLIPVMTVETVPGDHFEIDMAHLCKTTPLNTDAFARMRLNMEAFFVPYEQLWHYWPTFLSQRQVDKTSYHRESLWVPYFKRQDFLSQCRAGVVNRIHDIMGVDTGYNALRLADMLGYGAYQNYMPGFGSDFTINDDSNFCLNVFRVAAYNKIWYDYYRNKFWDTDKNHIKSFNFDDIGSVADPDFSSADVSTARMLLPDESASASGSAWPTPDALFQMRYRQWKKDLFTSALPSQQFGLIESVGLGTFSLTGVTPASSSNPQVRAYGAASKIGYDTGEVRNYNFTSDAAITVYQLKKAEAMQKWKETVLRAGEDFRSQMEARYGVRPKYSSLDSVDFLGSYSSEVEINPVYATAESEGVPLGDMAGRAQSAATGHVSYTAQDFGVIMVICSIVPESEYCSIGIDKQNTLSDPFDFFTPEIEDLGLEPVFHYQLDSICQVTQQAQTGDFHIGDPSQVNQVYGYSSRYSMYKTAIDKIHGEFIPYIFEGFDDYATMNTGSLQHWALPRTDLVNNSWTLTLSELYIDPLIDRPLFVASGVAEKYDHFIINSFFSVHAVRPMSVIGLPQW